LGNKILWYFTASTFLMKSILPLFLLAVFFYNCTRSPYAATNKDYKRQVKQLANALKQTPPKDSLPQLVTAWVGTTNFNMRKPNLVVIHHTAQNSCDQTLKTFTTPRTSVSAHYVICKDGTVHHMLNDMLRAWHAGVVNGEAIRISILLPSVLKLIITGLILLRPLR
jgi:N-acetylmuramoyl-L-alanine amidase